MTTRSIYDIKKFFETTQEFIKFKLYFEHKLAANIREDNKHFFAYIISKQKVKDRVGPLKDIDGNVITKSADIAESLNDYFSSVSTLEDAGKLPTIPNMIGENEELFWDGGINRNVGRDHFELFIS